MPGETATQHSFGYSSPSRMYGGLSHSYEAEMGISPQAFTPMFEFRKRHGEINWRKVAMIDVDKVARELDVDTLQEHIQTVAFCNVDAVADLDPMFSKLFKLSQYMIEYMLHSQSSLQSIIAELEGKLEVAATQQNSAQDNIKQLNDEIQKLKSENKKRRKMIEQQQMLIESGASSYYKCPHCEKAFMNASFLQGHMQRKHPGSVNYIGDVIAHSQREQSRLAGKLQNLDEDLQQERINFTEKLRKAEEEKAAWGARTRRDMQRWKKEEEGKWRKELDTMKTTFLNEIKQLKAQEVEYKQRITNLQHTMDERHSNLGELVDDIEGEKQKLSIYEQRIQSLEQTNADKEAQLKRLAAEMTKLREQNKRALADHGKQISDTYDSQLQHLKDKLDRSGRVPKDRKIVPVIAPPAAEPLDDELDGGFSDSIAEMRRNQKNIAKQMRPLLEQMMEDQLQQCGVDPSAPGISTQTLTNKLMVRKTERQRKAKNQPGLYSIRDQLRRKVDEEVNARKGSPPRKRRGRHPSHLPKQRQFSPSPASASRSLEQYSAPQQHRVPAGRIDHPPNRARSKTDQPMTREELNTRYGEDDDSPWDSELSDQPDGGGTSRRQEPETTAATVPKVTVPKSPVSASTPKTPVTARIPTSTPKQEDSWDSDDLDDLLSPETDVRETRPKSVKIQQLGSKIESQLEARTSTRPPAGSVDLLGGKQQKSNTEVKNLESDEDDFSLISSLNESPKPAPRTNQQPKVRQSTASSTNTFGTSVWGSNQGKPGAGKDGTAEHEVSDWDDDISDL